MIYLKLLSIIQEIESNIISKIRILLLIIWDFDEAAYEDSHLQKNKQSKNAILNKYKKYISDINNIFDTMLTKIDEIQVEILSLIFNDNSKSENKELIDQIDYIANNIKRYK